MKALSLIPLFLFVSCGDESTITSEPSEIVSQSDSEIGGSAGGGGVGGGVGGGGGGGGGGVVGGGIRSSCKSYRNCGKFNLSYKIIEI